MNLKVNRNNDDSHLNKYILNCIFFTLQYIRYPSEAVLLSSYKTESKWVVYREKIVEDALRPLAHQARCKKTLDHQQNVKTAKIAQDSRLLSTLQRNQQREQRHLDFIKEHMQQESMALDDVYIPNEDDENFTVGCNTDGTTIPKAVSTSVKKGSRSIPKPIRIQIQRDITFNIADHETPEKQAK